VFIKQYTASVERSEGIFGVWIRRWY